MGKAAVAKDGGEVPHVGGLAVTADRAEAQADRRETHPLRVVPIRLLTQGLCYTVRPLSPTGVSGVTKGNLPGAEHN